MRKLTAILTIGLVSMTSIGFGQMNTNSVTPAPSDGVSLTDSPAKVGEDSAELKAYKARLNQAIRTRWLAKVAPQMQLMTVGTVRIQYTVHADGTIETKVLDSGGGTNQILLVISESSIHEVSPFLPFTDSLRKEVGESFTVSAPFTIK